jgi:low affinity Fe/Cu permease
MPDNNNASWSFSGTARQAACILGTPAAFAAACGVVVLWAATGPASGYSDTWQLVINTGTTIVTFLMVFLVQHTQNRETRALHLKMDELLRSMDAARNRLINLEGAATRKSIRSSANSRRLSSARSAKMPGSRLFDRRFLPLIPEHHDSAFVPSEPRIGETGGPSTWHCFQPIHIVERNSRAPFGSIASDQQGWIEAQAIQIACTQNPL